MAPIEIKEIRNDYDLWDELVEKSPQGTIFHGSKWLTACGKSLNKDSRTYGFLENGRLIAGCSFYVYKKGPLRIASSAMFGTPFGGVILAESRTDDVRKQEENLGDIVELLYRKFENERFDYIRLVNSPDFLDIRPFTWNGWGSIVYYTYYLDLSNLDENISKDVRWTTNKARKSGVVAEKSEDIAVFYELFEETYVRQGLRPPASEDFLMDIFNLLRDQSKGEMWIARTKSGEVAAAEIFIYDNKRAYRWSAASHTELRKTGAPSLLLYEILNDLRKRGIKEVNLMAANTPQLSKFMAQFNPRLVPYYGLERKRALASIAEHLLRRRN